MASPLKLKQNDPKSMISQGDLLRVAIDLLPPILLILLVVLDIPFWQTFELDYDEGINLMKAFLYWKGIPLYTETWNDQPPLLTFILSLWFNVVGSSVVASRLLILCFSTLLVGSFYQVIKDKLGRIPAFCGSLFLIFSGPYAKLSVSVMIGLPSLALAMLSIYSLTLYQRYRYKLLLILSGCLLALSLQIKLFTIFLIPLIVLLLLTSNTSKTAQPSQKEAILSTQPILLIVLLWLGSLILTYGLLGILLNSIHYDQLWQSHLEGSIKTQFDSTNGVIYLLSLMHKDLDLLALGAIATGSLVWKRRWADLFPLAWFLTAALLLLNHRPIWYHHYLLLSIPIAWLAAYGVALGVELFRPSDWRTQISSWNLKKIVMPGVAMVLLVISMGFIPVKIANHWGRPASQWEMVEILKHHRDYTQWVFSDRPIIPFYAALPMPPEVAVLSSKRLVSGNFTYDNLLEVLQRYRPEQIVLARSTKEIKSHRGMRRFLRENYTRTYAKAYSRSNPDAIAEHYLINTYPQSS